MIFLIFTFSFFSHQANYWEIEIKEIYIRLFLIALGIFIIFFKKLPLINIQPPLIHACFYTNKMKFIICYKYVATFIKALIFSIAIFMLSKNNLIDGDWEFATVIHIYVFILTSAILSWINYNRAISFFLLTSMYLLTSLLLLQDSIIALIISAGLLFICIHWLLKLQIDWDKFVTDSSYIYRVASIAYRNNLVEMLSLVYENQEESKYSISLLDLRMRKSWIITSKGLIEIIRKPISFFILNLTLFVISLLLFQNYIFLAFLLQLSLISNINRLSTDNIMSLLSKQRSGLILPFSNSEILYKSSIISIALISIYMLTLTVIRQYSIIDYIATIIVFSSVILVINQLYIKLPRYNKILIPLSIALNFGGLFFFYLLGNGTYL